MLTRPLTRRRARDEAMGIVSDRQTTKKQRPCRPGPWEKQQLARVTDHVTKDKRRWFQALLSAMKIKEDNVDQQRWSLPIEMLRIVIEFVDTRRIMMLSANERIISFHPDSGAVRTECVIKKRCDVRVVCVQHQLYAANFLSFIHEEIPWRPIGRSFKAPATRKVLVDAESNTLNATGITDAVSSASMLVVVVRWLIRPFLQCWRWSNSNQHVGLIELPTIKRPTSLWPNVDLQMVVWADRFIGLLQKRGNEAVISLHVYDTLHGEWWPDREWAIPQFPSVQYTVTDGGDMLVMGYAWLSPELVSLVTHVRLTKENVARHALEFERLVMDDGCWVRDNGQTKIVTPFNDSIYMINQGSVTPHGRARLLKYDMGTNRCSTIVDSTTDDSKNASTQTRRETVKIIERDQQTDSVWASISRGWIAEY